MARVSLEMNVDMLMLGLKECVVHLLVDKFSMLHAVSGGIEIRADLEKTAVSDIMSSLLKESNWQAMKSVRDG
jgi:hypothetical protein